MHILFIGKNPKNADLLQSGLNKLKIELHSFSTEDSILEKAQSGQYNMILLDITSRVTDELDLISHLRQSGISMPVLILSPHRCVDEIVSAMRTVDTDFLLKPVTVVELRARITTLLKRNNSALPTEVIELGGITLDVTCREAYRNEKRIALQKNEFELLEFLMRNKDRVVTKAQIFQKIWNFNNDPKSNLVDVLVWRLREKIDKHFSDKVIQTVRGVGYIFSS